MIFSVPKRKDKKKPNKYGKSLNPNKEIHNRELVLSERNLSSTELESGMSQNDFLQTPAPKLDRIPGPMGVQFYPVLGWGLAPSYAKHISSQFQP